MRKLLPHQRTHASGFTLIELLVAMTIFILVTATAMLVFTHIIRSQQIIGTKRSLQEESRFLMEKIVKEFRNGSVDFAQYHIDHWIGTTYAEYSALPTDETHPPSINDGDIYMPGSTRNLEQTLNIIDPDGLIQTRITFNALEERVEIQKLESCLTVDSDIQWDPQPAYAVGYEPLSAAGINVIAFDIFIYPLKDPHKVFADKSVQYQPTIVLHLTTTDIDYTQQFELQTSIAGRTYDASTWATPSASC